MTITCLYVSEEANYEDFFQETLSTILEELSTVKHRAADLAISLRIRESSLPSHPPTLKDVISAWLRQQYNVATQGPPTWRLLARRVADDTGGADRALAIRIANKHPG